MFSSKIVAVVAVLCVQSQSVVSLTTSPKLNDTRPVVTKPHYRVVTIPEAGFIEAGQNGTFTGFYIQQLDRIANESGFTYDITAQPDGKYGSESNGTWSGMVGSLVNGSADIALGNMALTDARTAVVDSGSVYSNLKLWMLVNPRKPKSKAQYMVREGLIMEILKGSKDNASNLVWTNIDASRNSAKDRSSIAKDLKQAESKAMLGNFIYVDTEQQIRTMANEMKPVLTVDTVPLTPNVPVAYLTTRKGFPLALSLKKLDGGLSQAVLECGPITSLRNRTDSRLLTVNCLQG